MLLLFKLSASKMFQNDETFLCNVLYSKINSGHFDYCRVCGKELLFCGWSMQIPLIFRQGHRAVVSIQCLKIFRFFKDSFYRVVLYHIRQAFTLFLFIDSSQVQTLSKLKVWDGFSSFPREWRRKSPLFSGNFVPRRSEKINKRFFPATLPSDANEH